MAERQEWEAVDPCYGMCPIGSMPCTPEGCPENHPVGRRVLVGPRALEVDSDGCVEFESERETLLMAASKELLAALEAAPLPSVQSKGAEFYCRFYDWFESVAKPAVAKAKGWTK